MNEVTHDEKDALTKTLAIAGFVALVVFGVWLAVKVVSFVPSAFSSLASLADSVYNYNKKEAIVVAGENNVYNAGEAFDLTWENMRRPGTYTFSYACTEGVSVDTKTTEGDIVSVDCGEPFDLGNTNSISLSVASEKNRFTDIPYTITYTKDGSESVSSSLSRDLTVVNVTIPVSGALVKKDENVVSTPKPSVPVAPVYLGATEADQAPVAKPTPKTVVKTVAKEVYTTPVSNPNGISDLQVTYLGAGTIVGGAFVKSAFVDADASGAIQFEIKNIGTKTVDAWSYTANLPGDITHTSGAQTALKPNERAVITLGFGSLENDGQEEVRVTATAKSDTNTKNNSVSSVVVVKD